MPHKITPVVVIACHAQKLNHGRRQTMLQDREIQRMMASNLRLAGSLNFVLADKLPTNRSLRR